jgi:prepilin-type N-terminal cleavage/methylation domain-containing protein
MPLQVNTATPSRKLPAKAQRGFTLVELMIVVAVVGVLSAVGIYGVKKYVNYSAASEAGTIITAIRGAEEVYRQDTLKYFDVSEGDFSKTNPEGNPTNKKKAWASGSTTAQRFREMGVQIDGAVSFTYAVVAGGAGASFPTLPTKVTTSDLKFPATAAEPFYVIVAKSDLDANGKFGYMVSHSLSNEAYTEAEGQ